MNSITLSASVRLEGDRSEWHGAEQLAGALAAAYASELAAAAERLAIPVSALEVDAAAHLTARRDGRHAFTAFELEASVETDEAHAEKLQLAAELALDRCPVTQALDVPLTHRLRILQEVHR